MTRESKGYVELIIVLACVLGLTAFCRWKFGYSPFKFTANNILASDECAWVTGGASGTTCSEHFGFDV